MAKIQAVIYTRFSPRRNSDDCLSCEAQRDMCEEYCVKREYEVIGYYEDKAASGSEIERANLWLAVQHTVEVEGRVLIAYKADRLARDVYLHECIVRALRSGGCTQELVEGGIEGEGPDVELMRTILAAFDQYHVAVIRERTKAAMLWHQKNGRMMGGTAPYGYEPDFDGPIHESGTPVNMKEVPHEQEAIAVIKQLHAEGRSYNSIAQVLTERGYQPRGKSWSHMQPKRIIEREKQWGKM